MMETQTFRAKAWIVPAAVAAIIVATAVGLAWPLLADALIEGSTGWLATGMVALVAITETPLLRFMILPVQFLAGTSEREAARGTIEATATTQQPQADLASRVTLLAAAFAVAPAIYGAMGAIWTGYSLVALPFGAFALLSLAIYVRYIEARLDEMRLRARTGAD